MTGNKFNSGRSFDDRLAEDENQRAKAWDEAMATAQEESFRLYKQNPSSESREQARQAWDEVNNYTNTLENMSKRGEADEYQSEINQSKSISTEKIQGMIQGDASLKILQMKISRLNTLSNQNFSTLSQVDRAEIETLKKQIGKLSANLLGNAEDQNAVNKALEYMWSQDSTQNLNNDPAQKSNIDPISPDDSSINVDPTDTTTQEGLQNIEDSQDNNDPYGADEVYTPPSLDGAKETFETGSRVQERKKKLGKIGRNVAKLAAIVGTAFTAIGVNSWFGQQTQNDYSPTEYTQTYTPSADQVHAAPVENSISIQESVREIAPLKENMSINQLYDYVNKTYGYSQDRDTFLVDADQKTDENNFAKSLDVVNEQTGEKRDSKEVLDDLVRSIIDSPDMIAQFLLGYDASEKEMNDYADSLKSDPAKYQQARFKVLNLLSTAEAQILEKPDTFDTWWGEIVDGDVVMHKQFNDVKNDRYKEMVKIVVREYVDGKEVVHEREYDTECRNLIQTTPNTPGNPQNNTPNTPPPATPETPGVPGNETPPPPTTPETPNTPPPVTPETPEAPKEVKDWSKGMNIPNVEKTGPGVLEENQEYNPQVHINGTEQIGSANNEISASSTDGTAEIPNLDNYVDQGGGLNTSAEYNAQQQAQESLQNIQAEHNIRNEQSASIERVELSDGTVIEIPR